MSFSFYIYSFSFVNSSSLLIYFLRPNGKTFTVPRDDVHIQQPSLGDIVSFSYDANVRHDIPTRPSVFRIRTDVEWNDVVASARSDRHSSSGTFSVRKTTRSSGRRDEG